MKCFGLFFGLIVSISSATWAQERQSFDDQVRWLAEIRSGGLKSDQEVQELVQLSLSAAGELKTRATDTIRITNDPRAVKLLMDRLESMSPGEIIKAIEVIEFLGDTAKPAVKKLTDIILHRNDSASSRAVTAFEFLNGSASAAVPALTNELSNQNPDLRQKAIVSLGNVGSSAKESVPALVQLLDQSDPILKRKVLYSIGQIGSVEAIGPLTKQLKDSDPSIVADTVRALGKIGTSQVFPLLLHELGNPNARVRSAALSGIEKFAGTEEFKKATPKIVAILLSEEDYSVVAGAGYLFIEIDHTDSIAPQLLANALAEDDLLKKRNALNYLKHMNQTGGVAIDELIHVMLNSPDESHSERARDAIVQVQKDRRRSVVKLISPASTNNPKALKRVLEALPYDDFVSEDSIPFLEKLAAENQDPQIRKLALSTLESVKTKISTQPKAWPKTTGNKTLCEAIAQVKNSSKYRDQLNFSPSKPVKSTASWDSAIASLRSLAEGRPETLGRTDLNCNPLTNQIVELNFQNSMQSVVTSLKTSRIYINSSEIYFLIFQLTDMKVKNRPASEQQEIIDTLNHYLEEFRESGGDGDSGFNTFAWGSALTALGKDASPKSLEKLKKWTSSLTDPLAIPYGPNPPFRFNTRAGSSARNVPVHLALMMSDPSKERKETLVLALENWQKYSGLLVDTMIRTDQAGTHQGYDGIAQYYFYPSLPYVTASIKKLLADKAISGEFRERLLGMKKDLRNRLSALVSNEGDLQLIHSNGVRSVPAYAYPLYLLALAPLLEPGDTCYNPSSENNFGIVPN